MNKTGQNQNPKVSRLITFTILFLVVAPVLSIVIFTLLHIPVGFLLLGISLLFGEDVANSGAESLAFLSIPLTMLVTLGVMVYLWRLVYKKYIRKNKKGADNPAP